MTTEIRIPKLSMSMTEGEIAEWLVEDGASVEEGTIIYSIENDKSTQEIESSVAGTLRIIAPAGETYPVGHVVATIE
jgi:pyruvate/2-oxoglutarate dehydrogenase complex dihydrolipoamide acyltransferase (E2) component